MSNPTRTRYTLRFVVHRALCVAALGVIAGHAAAQTYANAADADRVFRIASARELPIGVFHQGVVVVGPDVNGDGVPDALLTTTHYYEAVGGVLPGRVMLVSGATGGVIWTAIGASSTSQHGRSAAFVDDLDADGVPDVLAGEFGVGRVVILSGATGVEIGVVSPPFSSELSSFGYTVAPFRRASSAYRYLLVGSPGVGRVHFYSLLAPSPAHLYTFPVSGGTPLLGLWSVNLGDLDQDGFDEIAATEPQSLGRVIVYSGADGSIAWHANVPGLSFGQSVAPIDDVSGDGRPDVFVVGEDYLRALRGADGATMFQLGFESPDLFRSVLGLGDVTGDGVPDFAIGNPAYPPEEDDSDPETIKFGRVTLYCGRTLMPIRVYDGPAPHAMMGHSLAAMRNADGAGATAVLARAHHKGPNADVNGVYGFVFIAPPPCPGDTNFDRVINKADFAAVLAQYGQSGPLPGDLNFDGVVDFADFALVLSRYGATCD